MAKRVIIILKRCLQAYAQLLDAFQYFQSNGTVLGEDDRFGVTGIVDLTSSGWMTHMLWASFPVQ